MAEQGQRESTAVDYWVTQNPSGMAYHYPETKFEPTNDIRGILDTEDVEFKTYFDSSDTQNKRAMLGANNTADAIKIAQRREVFNEAERAIDQDGIITQIGMSIVPAVASPTSLLPFGVVFKGAQVAKTTNRLTSGLVGVGAGGVTGAGANIADEALFDLQGMPTNYVGAGAIGFMFGGGLGFLGGVLSGPNAKNVANSIDPKNDSYTRDYQQDPYIKVEMDENGVPKLQDIGQMEKSFTDKLPLIGGWLRSDVHTVYQSDSPLLRGWMGRIASATTSLKDSAGNVMPILKTGVDIKRETKGVHNVLTREVNDVYAEARTKGYSNDLETFNKDVWGVYMEALNQQRADAAMFANQKTAGMPTGTKKVSTIDYLNDIPGASGEGVGPVRDRNFIAKGNKQVDDPDFTPRKRTGGLLDELLDDLDVPDVPEKVWVKQTPEEKAATQIALDKEKDAFDTSIKTEGMKEPVIVGYEEGKLVILEGNHRISAANRIGMDDVPLVYTDKVPDDMKFKETAKGITDAERNALLKANRDAMDEYYNTRSIEFKGEPSLNKAAESYRKYFQDMLDRSQKSGIKELQGMNPNRLYAPRTYNYKAIKDGSVPQEKVYSEVREGLANDVRNAGMTKEELEVATKDIVNKLNESAFDLNNLTTSYMVKDLPFSTHLKSKKLYLNESFMPNVVKSNFEEVTGAYHYKMSGRQSTQYAFGTDNLDEVMKMVREEHLSKGVMSNEQEIQAFERTVRDLMGDLRMNQLADTPSWSFTRNLTSFNSARLGGGFGGNQFIELASSIMFNGTKALLSGRMFTSLKNTKELLYTKGKTDDFANYLIGSGYMEDALHTSRINRYADTESGFNSGVVENKLNWINDKLMKYNGMRYFMGVMEDYTGAAVVTQLKAGKVDPKMLARWGMTEADGKTLQGKLKDITLDEGWNLEGLSLKERDQLQLAISRGIAEVVVQGDSIHLPAWMKAPGQFTKVLTQFMRFPLIAQETLLRRGMKEEQAKMAGAVMGSIGTYVGLKYLREQAAISLGTIHPIDAKYDYENYEDEDWLRVTGEALNYTAPLGFMSSVYNYGAIATGNNELGREWTSKNGMSSLLGPSGGLGEDLIQIMRSGVEGDFKDERSLQRWKSLVPFNNLPIINEAGKYLIEEYGDK